MNEIRKALTIVNPYIMQWWAISHDSCREDLALSSCEPVQWLLSFIYRRYTQPFYFISVGIRVILRVDAALTGYYVPTTRRSLIYSPSSSFVLACLLKDTGNLRLFDRIIISRQRLGWLTSHNAAHIHISCMRWKHLEPSTLHYLYFFAREDKNSTQSVIHRVCSY